jgi:putative heme iron utilization protein
MTCICKIDGVGEAGFDAEDDSYYVRLDQGYEAAGYQTFREAVDELFAEAEELKKVTPEDIVKRLRDVGELTGLEAADEIERLREAIREWGEAIVMAEGVLFTERLKHRDLIESLVPEKGYC